MAVQRYRVDDACVCGRYCFVVRPLRIALIGGPQYDQVQVVLDAFTASTGVIVEVGFRGEHVTLNKHVATDLLQGSSYDLISTHSKYAPSQAPWLQSLDELVSIDDLAGVHEGALKLCRVDGALMSVPRNVDARLLFINRELIDDQWAPSSWTQLLESLCGLADQTGVPGFAFPSRDSGLFGTFYELTAACGGHLFDQGGQPQFSSDAAREALLLMVDACRLRRIVPTGMVESAWHYDEVSAAFREGRVAVVGDWPGYFALLTAQSEVRDRVRFRLSRYPLGVDGARHVYAGCHAWAIPSAAADKTASLALLAHLTSRDAGVADAAAGMVPVRQDVSMPSEDSLDLERAELLRLTVATDLLTFPPMPQYPAIEDAAAVNLRSALLGELSITDALAAAQRAARIALAV